MNREAWLWFFQRVSAALVFFVLLFHIYHVHYTDFGGPIVFLGIKTYLSNIIALAGDIALLLLCLFHGLNGLRTVILDFSFFKRFDGLISAAILAAGIVFSIWGIRGLWAFMIIR